MEVVVQNDHSKSKLGLTESRGSSLFFSRILCSSSSPDCWPTTIVSSSVMLFGNLNTVHHSYHRLGEPSIFHGLDLFSLRLTVRHIKLLIDISGVS